MSELNSDDDGNQNGMHRGKGTLRFWGRASFYAFAPEQGRGIMHNTRLQYSRSRHPQLTLTAGEPKERTMEWTSPKFEEICLNCEINSYANAEL